MILCCQEIVSVVQVETWSSTVCANNDKDERKQR